jgi:hypothetical protein
MTPAEAALLRVALRHRVITDNVEDGCERVLRLAGGALDAAAFHAAVAGCLARGLIREPVRLPEGALQCHWHLELTQAGVATARTEGRLSS